MLKKTKAHCLRLQMLADLFVTGHPLKLCGHLKKPSSIQRHRGARSLFPSCRTKAISVKLRNCLCFPYHIGRTCPVKDFSWSRNGAFCGTKKKNRAATHIPTRSLFAILPGDSSFSPFQCILASHRTHMSGKRFFGGHGTEHFFWGRPKQAATHIPGFPCDASPRQLTLQFSTSSSFC